MSWLLNTAIWIFEYKSFMDCYSFLSRLIPLFRAEMNAILIRVYSILLFMRCHDSSFTGLILCFCQSNSDTLEKIYIISPTRFNGRVFSIYFPWLSDLRSHEMSPKTTTKRWSLRRNKLKQKTMARESSSNEICLLKLIKWVLSKLGE